MDYNSIGNQRIKEKFISKHVYYNITTEVEYILSKSWKDETPYTYDDVENRLDLSCGYCNECKTHVETNKNGECAECKSTDIDYDPQEVYQWFAVSRFLAEKLKEKGHPVLNDEYWGRCTCGQAISLDGVIDEICEEMEILEGQEYDWSK